MNPLNHEEAVDQVVEYLDSLSEAEFDKFLDSHGNGDFAVMLRETGALEAQMEESQMLGRALVPAMALPILWAETASLNVPIYYGMTKTSMPVSPAFYLAARSFIGDVAELSSDHPRGLTYYGQAGLPWGRGTSSLGAMFFDDEAVISGNKSFIVFEGSIRNCLESEAAEKDCEWATAA